MDYRLRMDAEDWEGQLCPWLDCAWKCELHGQGWYQCPNCGRYFYAYECDSDYEDYFCYKDGSAVGFAPRNGTVPIAGDRGRSWVTPKGELQRTPPDHSNRNCLCSLERQAKHPQTTWGHLQPRTMADPCPTCGGVDYYCSQMIDQVLSRDSKDFDAVMKALSGLYQEWCRVQQGPDNSEVHYYTACLMDAYNRWLG